MERPFHEELGALQQALLTMGGAVRDQLDQAMRAFVRSQADLARTVIERDATVNAHDVEIDKTCVTLLALHQPAARDLRFLVAAMKIVTDLERIGDQAVNVARAALRPRQKLVLEPTADLSALSERTQWMVKGALEAFLAGDAGLARDVCALDDIVDATKARILRELLAFMMENPRGIGHALNLIMVSRYLERVADHATNIAEMVIYIVDGTIVRHPLSIASLDASGRANRVQ